MTSDEKGPVNLWSTAIEVPASDGSSSTVAIEALGVNRPQHYYTSLGFLGTVLACCLAGNAGYAAWSLPSNALPQINADIGPSSNLNWIALSNTLGLAIGFLIVGRLSDIFGRRYFMLGGVALGIVGSIVGATAQRVETLIGANLLAGLASAAENSWPTVISELVPNKHRPLWIAGIFFSSFPFPVFGPVIVQVLSANTAQGWRWCYYISIIVVVSCFFCFFFFYHPPTFEMLHSERSRRTQLKRLDYGGLFLYTAGLTLLILGLNWGGTIFPWSSAAVIATIIIGVVTLAVFVFYEARIDNADPLLPIRLFKNGPYMAMVGTAMVGSAVYFSMTILWPQQIRYLFDTSSPIHRGLLAGILGGATLVGQMIAGALCAYIKNSRWILVGACTMLLAFAGSMISIGPGDETKGVALMFMACFSVGVLETSSLSLAPLSLPPADIGLALGVVGSLRSTGASIGVAVYSVILSNTFASNIAASVPAAAESAGLPASSAEALISGLTGGIDVSGVPGVSEKIVAAARAALAQAAAGAFRSVWYAVVASALLAVGAALCTKNYGDGLTDEVARKLHGRTVREVGADGIEAGKESYKV